jgi:hypothetical protein
MQYRQTKVILLLASLTLLTFAGCGKSTGQEQSNLVSNTLCYRAVDNGCDTGKHCFGTTAEFCAALQDEVLNNNCAQYARKNTFFIPEGCPGTFTPKY